jgi:hypothetical protein
MDLSMLTSPNPLQPFVLIENDGLFRELGVQQVRYTCPVLRIQGLDPLFAEKTIMLLND